MTRPFAAALLAAGHAYERDGFVYFRGEGVALRSGLSEKEALERSRDFGDDPDDTHRDSPFDVPVWRPSPENEPAWPSPWGWGRPGWHAECAAMAWATFGTSIDVIVGGEDLTYPHHAYQCGMVEAASGVALFARREVHIGAVHKGGRKMAKSTGNMTLVGECLTDHRPAAVRLMIVNRPLAPGLGVRRGRGRRGREVARRAVRGRREDPREPRGGGGGGRSPPRRSRRPTRARRGERGGRQRGKAAGGDACSEVT